MTTSSSAAAMTSVFQPDPETIKQVVQGSMTYAKYLVASHKKLFPESKAECFEMCGGVVVYVSSTSPLTQLIGFGVTKQVLPTDFAFLRQYFHERGLPLRIRVTQFTQPSLIECLAGKQFKTSDFTFMLARRLDLPFNKSSHPGIEIKPIENERLWLNTFAAGHCEGKLDEETEDLARTFFHAERSQILGAWVNGEIAGAAMVTFTEKIAAFNAACTLPAFRGMGIQKALIEHRMDLAVKNGLNLAMSRISPGSISHRNYTKLGFNIGYFTMLLEEIP